MSTPPLAHAATPHHEPDFPPSLPLGGVLVAGFTGGGLLWLAWFLTHLPWVGVREQVALPIGVIAWLIGLCVGVRLTRFSSNFTRRILLGGASGFLSALLGLLILGSKITRSTADASSAQLIPNALAIVVGFLALGGVLGSIAGAIAGRTHANTRARTDTLARFAWVCVCITTPLVFIGGLVTSTNSGMAVPDWPNTYGSNMFLYPLGNRVQRVDSRELQPQHWESTLSEAQRQHAATLSATDAAAFVQACAQTKIFFEHSHRLFGAFAGLGVVVLFFWTLRANPWPGSRAFAAVLLAFVILQGVLGGVRVRMDNRFLAAAHGVSGQLLFGGLAGFAALCAPWRAHALGTIPPLSRRAKSLAAGAMHSTILQLLFGAAYRHTRHLHVLYAHAAFSIVVSLGAIIAGFVAIKLARELAGSDIAARRHAACWLRRGGVLVVVCVGAQFLLGWLAFFAGGRSTEAKDVSQAIIRTLHQANGAILLAGTVVLWLTCLRVYNAGKSMQANTVAA